MIPNDSPLNSDAALDLVLSDTRRLDAEEVSLKDSLGRVLAEDVCSTDDIPPFDNSAMDGYAVIAEVQGDTPRKLSVIAEAPAGTVVSEEVVAGTAVRIMTGAPIPRGADTVVMVEDTTRMGSEVLINREAKRGANIRPAGEDVRRGELVMRSGRRIRPAEMGMLASIGKTNVSVYRRPRVAIITSGSELVDVSDAPGPGQIRNSNQYSLLGQVLAAGAEVSVLARVIDERAELERVVSSATAVSDVIVASGGVSVGDYDFVKDTLAKLGEILFWKVNIKPGKPLLYGQLNGIPMFGLPGNPVSSMITFDLFVRPCLFRMMGLDAPPYRMVSGTVTQDIRHKPGVRELLRASTHWSDGGYSAVPWAKRGSGILSSMVNSDSYVVLLESRGDVLQGESVDILLFES